MTSSRVRLALLVALLVLAVWQLGCVPFILQPKRVYAELRPEPPITCPGSSELSLSITYDDGIDLSQFDDEMRAELRDIRREAALAAVIPAVERTGVFGAVRYEVSSDAELAVRSTFDFDTDRAIGSGWANIVFLSIPAFAQMYVVEYDLALSANGEQIAAYSTRRDQATVLGYTSIDEGAFDPPQTKVAQSVTELDEQTLLARQQLLGQVVREAIASWVDDDLLCTEPQEF